MIYSFLRYFTSFAIFDYEGGKFFKGRDLKHACLNVHLVSIDAYMHCLNTRFSATPCVCRQIHICVKDGEIILQWEFVVKIKTS